jgi:hypothetical protein
MPGQEKAAGSSAGIDVRRWGTMLDVIFLAATGFFFALGIVYVRACERLR